MGILSFSDVIEDFLNLTKPNKEALRVKKTQRKQINDKKVFKI
jgi:hypothetical protein